MFRTPPIRKHRRKIMENYRIEYQRTIPDYKILKLDPDKIGNCSYLHEELMKKESLYFNESEDCNCGKVISIELLK